jgi:hypothetical protein
VCISGNGRRYCRNRPALRRSGPTVGLLLTITTAPCTERTGSTDDTGCRTDGTGRAGIPGAPCHAPGIVPWTSPNVAAGIPRHGDARRCDRARSSHEASPGRAWGSRRPGWPWPGVPYRASAGEQHRGSQDRPALARPASTSTHMNTAPVATESAATRLMPAPCGEARPLRRDYGIHRSQRGGRSRAGARYRPAREPHPSRCRFLPRSGGGGRLVVGARPLRGISDTVRCLPFRPVRPRHGSAELGLLADDRGHGLPGRELAGQGAVPGGVVVGRPAVGLQDPVPAGGGVGRQRDRGHPGRELAGIGPVPGRSSSG